MPIDLEVLFSATRPSLYSYSPFVDGRFPIVSGYDDHDYNVTFSLPKNHFLVGSEPKQMGVIHKRKVFQSYNDGVNCKSKTNQTSCKDVPDGTRKKKVSFADDRGLNLVEVREIPGIQKRADDVLTVLVNGSQRNVGQEKQWKLSNEHPPWSDEKILEILENNMVALESVSVKGDAQDILYGEIKVKNLAYEKKVLARITFDRWVSYVDVEATYLSKDDESPEPNSKYDTFCFSTKIPPSALKYNVIEFSICFQCNGIKYWDNSGGINYRLVADSSSNILVADKQRRNKEKTTDKVTLSLTENIERFSEIDAWSNLMYNQPYW